MRGAIDEEEGRVVIHKADQKVCGVFSIDSETRKALMRQISSTRLPFYFSVWDVC